MYAVYHVYIIKLKSVIAPDRPEPIMLLELPIMLLSIIMLKIMLLIPEDYS